MQIKVCGIVEAVKFKPQIPTYAIRIFNTDLTYRSYGREQYRSSKNYVQTSSYEFDDIDTPELGKTCFDTTIAKRLLDDFRMGMGGCEMLMVQCTHGMNRSPAVALALNQIFNLGNDSDELYDKYPELTRSVYIKCLMASQEIGLGTFEIYGHPTLGTHGQMLAREKRLELRTKGASGN